MPRQYRQLAVYGDEQLRLLVQIDMEVPAHLQHG